MREGLLTHRMARLSRRAGIYRTAAAPEPSGVYKAPNLYFQSLMWLEL
jgi:hypothetical protein